MTEARRVQAISGALSLVVALLAIGAVQPTQAQAGCKDSQKPTTHITKKRVRDAVQCLFNKERGAANVKRNGQLEDAAQAHSSYMRDHGCTSHQCPGEAPLEERVRQTGYTKDAKSYSFGEVVASAASGYSPHDFVELWMGSPSHRAGILDGSYRSVGVGVAVKNGRAYYTAVLGERSG